MMKSRKKIRVLPLLGLAAACAMSVTTAMVYTAPHIKEYHRERRQETQRKQAYEDERREERQVEQVAVEYIKTILKAPATAQFSNLLAIKKEGGEYRYTVWGSVDAHNSYGAFIRNEFVCRVAYDGSKWHCIAPESGFYK